VLLLLVMVVVLLLVLVVVVVLMVVLLLLVVAVEARFLLLLLLLLLLKGNWSCQVLVLSPLDRCLPLTSLVVHLNLTHWRLHFNLLLYCPFLCPFFEIAYFCSAVLGSRCRCRHQSCSG
jgi:hypothetical protein